ncbi:E3 ubiquitin-protein ligase BRE1 [Smittium culicis]|uniref:E3 ubiquitin protein ligase n=1 Tax=Smittium culicis TaxID=133412 RepID=A0A1R1XS80_9FUNG|nr:E3 ubiquitin-protein ligase BRE1 [Smittium culicis]OMJ17454.1 E3 ubiquitin-protein ligase BRE1 [Smittium culicis]
MMTERKRGFEDEIKDQSSLSPKKKKYLDQSKPGSHENQNDDNMDNLINIDEIRNFQKEAIWRQMMEYKRESLRDKERVKQLEARQLEWTKRISHFCLVWEKSSENLKNTINPDSSKESSSSWLQLMVGDFSLNSIPDDISSNFSFTANKLEEKTQELCSFISTVATQNLGSTNIDYGTFFNNPSNSEKEIFSLKSQIDICKLQISDFKKTLADREEDLKKALKKADRLQCPIASALDSGKSLSDANIVPEINSSSEIHKGNSPITPSTSMELDSIIRIADGRLNEIKKITEECSQLKAKVDQLTIDSNSQSSELISGHPAYLHLSSQLEYFQADSVLQRAEKEKLYTELQDLKASRRAYQAQLQSEEISQRQVLEQALQKVQQDLIRVRSHRDQIQRELEERRMRDSVEENSLSELKSLSDSLHERMKALMLENRRLRAHISALSGSSEGVEFYSSDSKFEDMTVTEELRLLLKQSEDKVRLLEDEVKNSDTCDKDLSTIYKPLDNNSSDISKEPHILTEAGSSINEKSNTLDEIKEKLRVTILQKEELEKTSLLMEHEMQAIISAFSKLEDQTTHKVLNLVSKEQMIRKLIAEKAKYEEKFLALNKDREAQKAALSSLRFQNTKQLDHIKSVDEREQNLHQQLALLEQHLLSLRTSQLQCQNALQESDKTVSILQRQIAESERKIAATNELLQSRESTYDKATFDLAREKEIHNETKRKLESLESSKSSSTNASSNGKSDLSELVEEYKSLLKCPSCHRNFKTHVLSRCMHVFCKGCIDSRIETRQRKCPSCGEAFGVNDVRQIYL